MARDKDHKKRGLAREKEKKSLQAQRASITPTSMATRRLYVGKINHFNGTTLPLYPHTLFSWFGL